MLTVCSASAETYYLGEGTKNANFPSCFKFYSDEARTTQVSVTPAAGDGNTYVVFGAGKMNSCTVPAGTSWIFGTDGTTYGTKSAKASFQTNGGVSLNFGVCTIYGINVQNNTSGYFYWGGITRLSPAVRNSISAESTSPAVRVAPTSPGSSLRLKASRSR